MSYIFIFVVVVFKSHFYIFCMAQINFGNFNFVINKSLALAICNYAIGSSLRPNYEYDFFFVCVAHGAHTISNNTPKFFP
jgi:hypothetical protein